MQVYTRPKIKTFFMGLFFILSIKDVPVKCAKVFDKSVVVLMSALTFGEPQFNASVLKDKCQNHITTKA